MHKKYIKERIILTIKAIKIKPTLVSSIIMLLSFTSVFLSGSTASQTRIESCANYFADIASNHTIKSGKKELAGLIIEPKDDSGKSMQSTYSELLSLYGTFREDNVAFAPVVNANKERQIYFSNSSFSSNPLSFLYSSVGAASIPYQTNEKGEIVNYIFQCYPLATMFESGHKGTQPFSFIYISQTHAKNVLISRGYEEDNLPYSVLLGETIQLLLDGTPRDFVIENIYLDNYYSAKDISSVIGDFVFTYMHGADASFLNNYKKQGLYFMSKHAFRNQYYLEYGIQAYGNRYYDFKFATYNLKDGYSPDVAKLNSIFNNKVSLLSVVLTIVSIAFAICSVLIILKYKIYKSNLSLIFVLLSAIIPYLVFKIVCKLSGEIILFSRFSTTFNLILFVSVVVILLLTIFIGRVVLKKGIKK